MSASSPLHDAARLLIAEASPETVRIVLRLLLDNVAPAAAPRPARPPPLSPASARPGRKHAARRAPTNAMDPDWEELRQQVRGAMTEQGATYADLAAAVDCSAGTVRVSLYRHQPASQRLINGFRAWLAANTEQASGVATPAIPFRNRGGDPARATPAASCPRVASGYTDCWPAGCALRGNARAPWSATSAGWR
jgi:hypothetical protein